MGQGSTAGNAARIFALVFGLGYVAIGVVGFVSTGFTGFVQDTNEDLLGFDLNVFHNIVHLAIGAALVVASQLRDVAITQGVLIGVGLFYVVAALLGFIDYLQIISIDSHLAADNFLHLFSGLAATVFGLIGVRQQDRAAGPPPGRREGPRPLEERRALWDTGHTYREETY